MTTVETMLSVSLNSDAEFRLWAKGLSDALTAAGIPKTADTGQADWTTVTVPAANNTAAGYEIRYFNDSLNATAPIYIKIEYGKGNTTSQILLWFTVGSGTDGAGNLTAILARQAMILNSVNATFPSPWWISASVSGFVMAYLGTPWPTWLHIERSRNSAGAITADGVLGTSMQGYSQVMPYHFCVPRIGGGYGSSTNSAGGLLPRSQKDPSMMFSSVIPVAPLMGFLSTGPVYSLQMLTIPYSPANFQLSVPRFGSSRRYRCIGGFPSSTSYGFGMRHVPNSGEDVYAVPAILWD